MNSSRKYICLGITSILLFLPLNLYAQSPEDRIQTSDKMQQLQRVMEQYEDVDEDTGPYPKGQILEDDAGDLGRQRILRRRSRHKYYSGGASLTLQSSDNATLGMNVSYNENHSNFPSNEYDSFSGSFLLSTQTRL